MKNLSAVIFYNIFIFQLHSTDSLRTYLNSFSGQRQFVSNSKQTSIVVSGERCDDVTGCACGNDNSLVRITINKELLSWCEIEKGG